MNFGRISVTARIFGCLFLFYVLFAEGGSRLFAQPASISDIVAGYKANASLFQGSRVCYKLTVDRKRDNYSYEGAYDYWSDGQDVLLRGGDLQKIGGTEKIFSGQFSDNITSQDLETIYKEIPVISYDSEGKLEYRWSVFINGSGPEEENKGEIVANTISFADDDDFYYPPFLPFTFDNVENIFPTDAFFSCSESDLHLLGTQMVDGEEYYVLESRVMRPEGLYQFQEDGMNFCSIQRAWIDIKRGCIPIRIEYLSALSKNGQLVDYIPSLQFSESCISIFEVQEIKKVGAGFYPVRASHRFMGLSKEGKELLQKALNDANDGDVIDIGGSFVYEVQSENRWEVSKIILDVMIDRETIVLPFPKGTVIFDERSEHIRVAGMTEKEYETMLLEESRSFGTVPDSGMNGELPDPNSKRKSEDYIPRSPRGWRSVFLIIGVNLIILAFILRYFLLARKQGKEQKE